LHGLYLIVNHAWHALRRKLGQDPDKPLSRPIHALSVLLTFLAVVLAWVFFRASDFRTAMSFMHAMSGANDMGMPDNWFTRFPAFHAWLADHGWFITSNGLATGGMMNWIWISLLIVWLAPNTQTIMQSFKPALDMPQPVARTRLLWRPSFWSALLIWGLAFTALINLSQQSTFLYFQF
jgi:hypothetical protein